MNFPIKPSKKKYNLPKGFPLLWNLFRTRKNIITEKGRFR